MKKTNFIWILAAFLLVLPMAFGEVVRQDENGTYFLYDISQYQKVWPPFEYQTIDDLTTTITEEDLALANAVGLNITLAYSCSRETGGVGCDGRITLNGEAGGNMVFGVNNCDYSNPTYTTYETNLSLTNGDTLYWQLYGDNGCGGACKCNIKGDKNATRLYLAGFTDTFLILNALDNYTKYGYEQSNITNFTATLTNGTDTLIGTANGTYAVILGNATLNLSASLWNITFSHDDYSNVTYENINVSDTNNYTGYMEQTHEHLVNSTYWIDGSTYTNQQSPDSNYLTIHLEYTYIGKWVFYLNTNTNTTNNSNVSFVNSIFLYAYKHYQAGSSDYDAYRRSSSQCGFNESNITYNNQPSCSTGGLNEGNQPVNSWNIFQLSSNTRPQMEFIKYWHDSSDVTQYGSYYSTRSGTNPPYAIVDYTSNFTLAVFDSITGDPVTTTDITINISNGAWSREDILSGTNTISYPFDEGIYNISIIVEGVEQTHSNYDLATESNYLEEEFTFYFNITNCSAGSSNIALNFTFKDEENQSAINGGLTPDFTLSTDFYNTTYSEDLSGDDVTNIYLCLDPSDIEVTLEWPSFVEYQPTDTGSYGYARFYYFANSTISGDNTQDIGLFNLEDSLSSETTFTMQKEGQNVAQGLIQVLRYYAAEQTSKVVAMKKTNTNGQATERVRQGDALYNILGYDENLALCYATPTAEELGSTLSIYCDVSGVTSNYWPLWLLYHYVSYDFAYNNATNVTTLTWAGVTGAPTEARFRVTKLGGASETTICDEESSSTSGTLDCTLTDLNAIYNLEFIAKLTYGATTGYFILASEFLELKQNLSDLIGKDGTFLAIFIIGLLAFTGLFNPAAAVLLATLGVVITSLMGLIPLGLGALVAIVLTGGIIAVKMRT